MIESDNMINTIISELNDDLKELRTYQKIPIILAILICFIPCSIYILLKAYSEDNYIRELKQTEIKRTE